MHPISPISFDCLPSPGSCSSSIPILRGALHCRQVRRKAILFSPPHTGKDVDPDFTPLGSANSIRMISGPQNNRGRRRRAGIQCLRLHHPAFRSRLLPARISSSPLACRVHPVAVFTARRQDLCGALCFFVQPNCHFLSITVVF
jgi:hypothetical protein